MRDSLKNLAGLARKVAPIWLCFLSVPSTQVATGQGIVRYDPLFGGVEEQTLSNGQVRVSGYDAFGHRERFYGLSGDVAVRVGLDAAGRRAFEGAPQRITEMIYDIDAGPGAPSLATSSPNGDFTYFVPGSGVTIDPRSGDRTVTVLLADLQESVRGSFTPGQSSLSSGFGYTVFGAAAPSGASEGAYQLRYQGHRKDEVGDGLNFGMRQYMPETGRFSFVDPEGQSVSPYTAFVNNRLNGRDGDGGVFYFNEVQRSSFLNGGMTPVQDRALFQINQASDDGFLFLERFAITQQNLVLHNGDRFREYFYDQGALANYRRELLRMARRIHEARWLQTGREIIQRLDQIERARAIRASANATRATIAAAAEEDFRATYRSQIIVVSDFEMLLPRNNSQRNPFMETDLSWRPHRLSLRNTIDLGQGSIRQAMRNMPALRRLDTDELRRFLVQTGEGRGIFLDQKLGRVADAGARSFGFPVLAVTAPAPPAAAPAAPPPVRRSAPDTIVPSINNLRLPGRREAHEVSRRRLNAALRVSASARVADGTSATAPEADQAATEDAVRGPE